MAPEIERKFLVAEPPAAALESPFEDIDQGYLVSDGGTEIRVRKKGPHCFLTVKKGHGEVREETEVGITETQLEELWPLTEGWRVRKRRHRVSLEDGLTAELDIYLDRLDGLFTVEVEFDSEPDCHTFSPPSWFGQEVTGEVAYSNQQMARQGRPPA
ncbi:MAG: CYTH domain-containing protein [Solirubrobacterales bacterium]